MEPGEAIGEIFAEILNPYVDEVKVLSSLGFEDAAVEVCQGILLGLYTADQATVSDAIEWRPELCAEATSEPLLALEGVARKRGGGVQCLPLSMKTFFRDRLPEWTWLLDSCPFE